jgi:glycosyltransferase involved in cell wall biosynthesis/SAM-dependent methyltransferase
MPHNRTLIFTATYNEAENIGPFCRAVLGIDPSYDLLVVDDHSPDGTGDQLDKLRQSEPRLKYLPRPRKLGLGTAHQLAMAYAVREGYTRLVTMDADFSHQPQDIPRLLAALEDSDFVIGSRYAPGGQCSYTGYRRFISLAGNAAARALLGCPLHEFTTSFRAFRVDKIEAMRLFELRSRGYSYFLDVVFRIHSGGWRIKEIPIHFLDRTAGRSKLPRFEIVKGIARLLKLFFSRQFPAAHRPTGLAPQECYQCEKAYCVRLFPKSGRSDHQVEAYKCTSLDHHSKPEVLWCLKCALRFVPERSNIEELYSQVVDQSYLEFKEARYRTFEATYRKIARHLGPQKSVLEVGSYCGFFLDTLRKHGITQVEGLEPSSWASQYARDELKLKVHTGSLEQLQGKLGRYDVAVMWDVFEHLVDPIGALRSLHEIVNDNGILAFSTLDMDNWFPRLLGARWPWLMDMHLFYPTTPVVQDLLEKSGFELVSAERYSHHISARYFAEKLFALSPVPVPGFLRRILGALAPRWVFIPFSFGDIKLYCARRKTIETPAEPERLTAAGRR